MWETLYWNFRLPNLHTMAIPKVLLRKGDSQLYNFQRIKCNFLLQVIFVKEKISTDIQVVQTVTLWGGNPLSLYLFWELYGLFLFDLKAHIKCKSTQTNPFGFNRHKIILKVHIFKKHRYPFLLSLVTHFTWTQKPAYMPDWL